MTILGQKASPWLRGRIGGGAPAALVAGLVLGSAAWVQAQAGQIECSVTENGSPARGTIVVEQDGRKVAAGSCSAPVSAPPGKYDATVRLEGVLDNPAKTVRVEVFEGKTAPVAVRFETASVEVRIETKGQRGTAIIAVNREGKRVGTLGAGVAAHLSAGSYEIVVRLGGQERRYIVDLRPGQRRVVRAQF